MGYPSGVKGYKLWSLNDNKVVISRNVVFDETVFPMINNFAQADEQGDISIFEVELYDKNKGNYTANVISQPEENNDDNIEATKVADTGNVSDSDDTSETSNVSNSNDVANNDVANESADNAGNPVVINRSTRSVRMLVKFNDYIVYDCLTCGAVGYALYATNFINSNDPLSYSAAMKHDNWNDWRCAMNDEMDSLLKNKSWKLVLKPSNK